MKYPQLYYIEWSDAVSTSEGWNSREEVLMWGKNNDCLIKQAGYILEDNKTYLLVASKYNAQEATEDKYSELTKIPKTWLKKKKKIFISS